MSLIETNFIAAPCRRVFTGAQIADIAKRLVGVHGEQYGRRGFSNEGLDTVGLIERVGEEIGDPLNIPMNWQDVGGHIRLAEIPVELAEVGDVLEFDFSNAPRAKSYRHQLAILSSGAGVNDPRAQIVAVPHAVGIVWLKGMWSDQLVRAYRFSAKRER